MPKKSKLKAPAKPIVPAKPALGDMMVWWMPQVPCKRFEVPVRTVEEARLLIDTLAQYDMFQKENRIKPDYSNAGGLMRYEVGGGDNGEDGWCDWYDDDGCDINHPKYELTFLTSFLKPAF